MGSARQDHDTTDHVLVGGPLVVGSANDVLGTATHLRVGGPLVVGSANDVLGTAKHLRIGGPLVVGSANDVLGTAKHLLVGGHDLLLSAKHLLVGGDELLPSAKHLLIGGQELLAPASHLLIAGAELHSSSEPLLGAAKELLSSSGQLRVGANELAPFTSHLVLPGKQLLEGARHVLPGARHRLVARAQRVRPGAADATLRAMLTRRTARLRSLFQHVLLVSSGVGSALGAYACASDDAKTGGPDAAAATDGTVAVDGRLDTAAADPDGAADANADAPLWTPACTPTTAVLYDAGADVGICAFRTTLPCGLPSFVTSIEPFECLMTLPECTNLCTGPAFPFLSCRVANGFGCDYDAEAFVAADGEAIVVECDRCTLAGRRPAGLARAVATGARLLGAYFGGMSHLEAASVHAFVTLAGELRALGAPDALVQAAERSARDETRHARGTACIARRHGGRVPAARVRRTRARSVAAMALENAVEGCVHETFGALTATWQATHARDPGIARTMRGIARDETRHAALAWEIAAWLEPRLDARARARLRSARRRAITALRRRTATAVPAVLVRQAGVPPAPAAQRMIDALEQSLWRQPGGRRNPSMRT